MTGFGPSSSRASRRALKCLRYCAREVLGSDAMLLPTLRMVPAFSNRIVDSRTEICIEGFPRSANSYFYHVFTRFNPAVRVAHHLHVAGQVERSCRRRIPTVVLMRDPLDAVSSLLVADPDLPPRLALASYIRFYERIWAWRSSFVLALFQDATERPETVIGRLNDRFQSRFRQGRVPAALRDEIFHTLERHNAAEGQARLLIARPAAFKDEAKSGVREAVARSRLARRAIDLYTRYRAS
jgi:hypothetical protein